MTAVSVDASRREKQFVAASSVLAAIVLTGFKAVVGVLTGSLGILAEAAHSGLDLMAALITLFAVRVSDRPADATHPYGHGKVENLSALVETLLLLVTCAWIIYEAMQRLLFKTVEIEASFWAFTVMAFSIAIDYSRSRALMRAAKKYNSQALEADALHFGTDIYSSLVVIVGLVLVRLGEFTGERSLFGRADAVAALIVAVIVIVVSARLGKRTIDALVDAAPRGLAQKIETQVRTVESVADVRQVRVRQVGPTHFVDMSIAVGRSATFEEAHAVATQVERLVQTLVPRADIVVHVDPITPADESWVDAVRGVAARYGLGVHSLALQRLPGGVCLEFHVEVDDRLKLHEAHHLVSQLEADIKEKLSQVREVVSHVEPMGRHLTRHHEHVREAAFEEMGTIRSEIGRIAREMGGDAHAVSVHREGDALAISLHYVLDDDTPIGRAHAVTTELETRLRKRLKNVGRVVVHVEPASNP